MNRTNQRIETVGDVKELHRLQLPVLSFQHKLFHHRDISALRILRQFFYILQVGRIIQCLYPFLRSLSFQIQFASDGRTVRIDLENFPHLQIAGFILHRSTKMVCILQRSRYFLYPDRSFAPLLFLSGKGKVRLVVPKLPG